MSQAKALILLLLAHTALAQEFEAISIKPSPPLAPGAPLRVRSTGGPGSKDPTLYNCENCSLASLISNAYGILQYRLSAADWMQSANFIVNARLPLGTTREQFQEMMRSALAERFKLAIHRDKKEMPMYQLVIARGGPKLTPSEEEPPASNAPPSATGALRNQMGPDGYPTLAGGSTMSMMNGRARIRFPKRTTEWFAGMLSGQLGSPVTDATGLTGNYDFALYWEAAGRSRRAPASDPNAPPIAADPDAGPTLQEAIQSQLGLKLEPKKGFVDIIFVDHAEKVPTEN